MLRGREQEAEAIVREIEQKVSSEKGDLKKPDGSIKVRVQDLTMGRCNGGSAIASSNLSAIIG